MKRFTAIFAVALLAGSAAAAVAQPAPTGMQGQSSPQTGPPSSQASARYLTIVPTELSGKVDSKKATVGEVVTTIVPQAVKLADGTELPKGTKIVGKVTQVKAHSKQNPGSLLGLAFDHAELKGGKTIALRVAIRSIAPPAGMGGGGGAPMVGGSSMGSGAGAGGGEGGGGGGMGGPDVAVGGTGGVSATGGAPPSGGPRGGGGAGMGGAPMGMSGASGDAGGGAIPAGARRTMVPGVMLSAPQTQDGAGTLTSANDNVSLGDETQIVLVAIVR